MGTAASSNPKSGPTDTTQSDGHDYILAKPTFNEHKVGTEHEGVNLDCYYSVNNTTGSGVPSQPTDGHGSWHNDGWYSSVKCHGQRGARTQGSRADRVAGLADSVSSSPVLVLAIILFVLFLFLYISILGVFRSCFVIYFDFSFCFPYYTFSKLSNIASINAAHETCGFKTIRLITNAIDRNF